MLNNQISGKLRIMSIHKKQANVNVLKSLKDKNSIGMIWHAKIPTKGVR